MPGLICGHGRVLAGLDLAGMVVTLDALHAQRDAPASSPQAGGHYLMIVKATSLCWTLSPLHRPITEPGGAFLCRFIRLAGLFPSVPDRVLTRRCPYTADRPYTCTRREAPTRR